MKFIGIFCFAPDLSLLKSWKQNKKSYNALQSIGILVAAVVLGGITQVIPRFSALGF